MINEVRAAVAFCIGRRLDAFGLTNGRRSNGIASDHTDDHEDAAPVLTARSPASAKLSVGGRGERMLPTLIRGPPMTVPSQTSLFLPLRAGGNASATIDTALG
jgi:hypothetical protein